MKIPKPIVEVVALDKIKEWPGNPRRKHAVGAIAKSIERVGYLSPIIVQKDTMRILAGHGRYKALVKNGVTEVPVIIADVTDAQADAFTIADNKLTDMSQFDYGDLGKMFKSMDSELAKITGFSDGEINELAKISQELEDATGVGRDANKATIYAGDQVDSVNTTLFVTFPSREKLMQVKKEIRRHQVGNEKTMGQIVYERFFPELQ